MSSTTEINYNPTSVIENICKYDPTGSCSSMASSVKSFFENGSGWWQSCTGQIQQAYNNNFSAEDATGSIYNACAGPDTIVGKALQTASTVASTVAPWLRSSLPSVFSAYSLPELPKEIGSGETREGQWAVAAIVGSLVIPYLFASKNPMTSSLSSGGLLGAGVSLLFGQDPYLGALVGAVSKLAIDTITTRIAAPFQSAFEQVSNTIRPLISTINTLTTLALVLGIGYPLANTAIQNPWVAIPTILAAGSQYGLLCKIYQMKGLFSLATSAIGFCISHLHYPVIGYASLAAQPIIADKIGETPTSYAAAAGLLTLMLGYLFLKSPSTTQTEHTSDSTPLKPTEKKDMGTQANSHLTLFSVDPITGIGTYKSEMIIEGEICGIRNPRAWM